MLELQLSFELKITMNGNTMTLARSAEADGGSCRKCGVGHVRLAAASRLCGGRR